MRTSNMRQRQTVNTEDDHNGGTDTDSTATSVTASDVANSRNDATKPVLDRAPPPWHAVMTVFVMAACCLVSLPSLEKLDEIAAVETFTSRLFPDILSIRQLALIRAAIATVIWGTVVNILVYPGWEQMTPYLSTSKLKMVPNKITGIRTLYPFTSWSWIILGISFTLSSYVAWVAADTNVVVSPLLLRIAVLAWEIAAPCSILVATTVRYAIWPAVIKRGGPHSLNSIRNILMHNCNVLVALTESYLLSGLPVRWSEATVAPLWGCIYVIFSWNMVYAWNERRHGPQFIYFFLDTTLPGYTCSIALVALLVVLLTFYAVFCTAHDLLVYLNGGIAMHFLFVAVWCSLVMRFRD